MIINMNDIFFSYDKRKYIEDLQNKFKKIQEISSLIDQCIDSNQLVCVLKIKFQKLFLT